jgi:uncharacterized protein (DUF1810 family)
MLSGLLAAAAVVGMASEECMSESGACQGRAQADPYNLEALFCTKHRRYFQQALEELQAGHKRSCWSWYIFPTAPFVANGRERGSMHNRQYALRDEPPSGLSGDRAARAFLRFEAGSVNLRANLVTIMTVVAVQLERGVTPHQLVGGDATRLRASLELFERVGSERGEGAGGAAFDGEVAGLCARTLRSMA